MAGYTFFFYISSTGNIKQHFLKVIILILGLMIGTQYTLCTINADFWANNRTQGKFQKPEKRLIVKLNVLEK